MPTPTVIIPFGESSADGKVFAVVALDPDKNIDRYGNELSEFVDTEQVNILVHTESGANIIGVTTSFGSIANINTPKTVTREYTNAEVVFKGVGDEFTLPHYPDTSVSVAWKGRERKLSLVGRKLRCDEGAGICSISYKYEALQFIFEAPNLNLALGAEFPVEISFDIER